MSSSEVRLEVEGLSAAWEGRPVLRAVSFSAQPGELVVLLGPNGSGKTTLLRCIAGLEPLTSGRVKLDGRDLAGVPTHRRGLGFMFQDSALFPHRTVFENIAYAPLLQRRPRDEIDREVGNLVDLLGLTGFEDRRPSTLSGGERQKVALARSLAARPRLMLLDEPFASIDVEVKAELRAEFRRVLRSLGVAAVHVTHDREEGFFLGDRVGLLFDGQLAAWGTPPEVYERPTDVPMARFLGYNVVEGTDGPEAVDPHDLRMALPGEAGLDAVVLAAGTVGREALVVLRAGSGDRVELRAPEPYALPSVGSRVALAWSGGHPLTSPRLDPPKRPSGPPDSPPT